MRRDRVKLVSLSVIAGTRGPQRATIKLDIEGRTLLEECEGNGPVDATFNCIKSLVPHEAMIELDQVRAVTRGKPKRPPSVLDGAIRCDSLPLLRVAVSMHGKIVTRKLTRRVICFDQTALTQGASLDRHRRLRSVRRRNPIGTSASYNSLGRNCRALGTTQFGFWGCRNIA
jgi:hypothetical protein